MVANGAEGEPGTFKDRSIMRRDPYQVVTGAAIAAFTIGVHDVYIGVKASFLRECDALERAAHGSRRPACSATSTSRSHAAPTSTCSVKRRRCSK